MKTKTILDVNLIKELMLHFEGHNIYNPLEMIKDGWDEKFITSCITRIRSNPKMGATACAFDNEGNLIKDASLVEGLNLARKIALEIGADYSMPYFGRGRNGRHIQENILKRLKEMEGE